MWLSLTDLIQDLSIRRPGGQFLVWGTRVSHRVRISSVTRLHLQRKLNLSERESTTAQCPRAHGSTPGADESLPMGLPSDSKTVAVPTPTCSRYRHRKCGHLRVLRSRSG